MKKTGLQIVSYSIPLIILLLALYMLAPKKRDNPVEFTIKHSPALSESSAMKPPALSDFKYAENNIVRTLKKHWVYIEIPKINKLEKPILVVSRNNIENITLFKNDDFTNPIKQHSRWDTNHNQTYSNQDKVFDLLSHQDTQTFYLLFENKSSHSFSVNIWEDLNYRASDQENLIFFSAILFGLLLMIVINSFFYITIKDKAYLYYILYHSSSLFLLLFITGFIYNHPQVSWLTNSLSKGLSLLSVTCFIFSLFTQEFLSTKKYNPVIHKIINIYQYLHILCIVALFTISGHDSAFVYIVNAIALSSILIYLTLMAVQLKSKRRAAIFFTLAFSGFMIAAAFRILYILGVIEANFFSLYGAMIGTLIEAIIFSIGLGDRLMQMKEQRDSATIRNEKTQFAYKLEKRFNALTTRINMDIHKSKNSHYQNYLVDEFHSAFEDILELKSTYAIYQDANNISTVHSDKYQNKNIQKHLYADKVAIENIAQKQKSEIITIDEIKFLVVPTLVRNNEWGAVLFETENDQLPSRETHQFLKKYASELIHSILNANSIHAIKSKAEMDELTGLYNRGAIEALIKHELEKPYNEHAPLSVAFIDFDDFKDINDKYGHQAGDLCLKALAKSLKQRLPPSFHIGRFGGDEFIAILPATKSVRAYEYIQQAKNELTAVTYKDQTIEYKVSIGISSQNREDTNLESLLEQADKALYLSKKAGKNRIKSQ